MRDKKFQLNQHIWISMFLLLFLLVFSLIVSDVLTQIIFMNSRIGKLLITFACYAILCFLITPKLQLPRGKRSFSDYLADIRLRFDSNWVQILFISFTCYLIFALSQIIGSLIYFSFNPGHYMFDLGRNSLLNSGSLNSGIFEEIIFRGVILTLLLEHFSEKKAIIISAAAFAAIHLLNLLNPGDREVLWILAQVVWAFALGIMYSYLVIRMNSILPAMILHYLINALTGIWLNIPEGHNFISAVYNLAFFGVIPASLTILWVRYLNKGIKFKIWRPA